MHLLWLQQAGQGQAGWAGLAKNAARGGQPLHCRQMAELHGSGFALGTRGTLPFACTGVL